VTLRADLLVLDGRHLLWRTADAFRTLSTELDGETIPVGGVYGFLSVALRVHARYGGKTVVAWEGRRNFRIDLFPSYKDRDKEPDPERLEMISEMSQQERLLIALLQAMGVRQYRGVGCEADDVIGRLVGIGTRCRAITIVYSGDSDLRQLINAKTFTASPGKRSDTLYNSATVEEKHGVPPHLIAALKALAGDSSDCIPGLPGIGPKTAATLLSHYGRLAAIVRAARAGAEDWPVAERFKPVVLGNIQNLKLYYSLTKIRTEMALKSIPAKRSQREVVRQLHALKFRSLAAPAELHGLMRMGGQ
jgi:DNA polymerase-1